MTNPRAAPKAAIIIFLELSEEGIESTAFKQHTPCVLSVIFAYYTAHAWVLQNIVADYRIVNYTSAPV